MTIKKQHFWIDREHERIATKMPCLIGPDSDNAKPAVIINLSAGGLKFACNREAFNLLLPEDQRIPGQVSDVEIGIQFKLPVAGENTPLAIHTRGRIIHTERLAQDSYTLGVQFIDLDENDGLAIAAHIRHVFANSERL
jgi:hypothetical protein